MVNIISTFVEDIEKAFRGHLPQRCINILATMSEENRMLQKAVNDQMLIIQKLQQLMVLSAQADLEMVKTVKRFNRTYDDPHQDIVKSQDINQED